MRPQDIAQARRFVASPGASTADCKATPVGGPVLLIGPLGPLAPCAGSGAGALRMTAG
jgi:hypothetical protein